MTRRVELGPGREFDLIRRFLGNASAEPGEQKNVLLGPGDDCAVVSAEGVAVGSDMSFESIHFRRDWIEPGEIGYRAAAAAFSDLAAVAARPIGALASLAAADADTPAFADEVMAGVRDAARDCNAMLLGGDLVQSSGPLVLDAVVVGEVARPVSRAGARDGDGVFVTGALGGSAAAVAAWRSGSQPPPLARGRYARPRPRTREAVWLAEHVAIHAMLDLSDGLAGDATHLAAASGVALDIEADRVPVDDVCSTVASGEREALDLALSGGEDFELCFTAANAEVGRVRARFEERFDLVITRVGRVRTGSGVQLCRADGATEPLDSDGYLHFSAGKE